MCLCEMKRHRRYSSVECVVYTVNGKQVKIAAGEQTRGDPVELV